ncbi:MAG TPA: VRR-NUC domain-containing protein [Cytophagales bacterium]|nr:VRR-NUC domain-containing protein [Cytophagales bacterium]
MRKKTIKAYDFLGGATPPAPIKRKPKTATNSLTKQIIEYINNVAHAYAFRVNTGGTYSEALGKHIHSGSTLGVSDIIAVYQGRFFGFEVKQGSDKLRPKQEKFRDRVTGALGCYYEIRSFDQFLRIWTGAIGSIDKYDDAAIDGLKLKINFPG